VAEADFEADVRASMHGFLTGLAGEAPEEARGFAMVPRDRAMREQRIKMGAMLPRPAWLTAGDVDYYASEFTRTGFRGGLNWYRNIDRNWELLAPFAGAKITVPALYVAGERDLVLTFPAATEAIANLSNIVPRLTRTVMLPGCGHWTQQERPDEVNAAMIGFLRGL
jgi:pimeloyl-ACP methyl ester carboxylesterase